MSDPVFETDSHPAIRELVQSYPLAWVISPQHGDTATPLPLLAECDDAGRIVSLFGHMGRRNQLARALEESPQALVLFQGPQAYVSPRIVSQPQWGATWNYAVARFQTSVEFVPGELDTALSQLATHVERGCDSPWTPADMGSRYGELKQYIISFRAHVKSVRATFKLGQDESADTFEEIICRHDNEDLVDWMRRFGRV